MNILKDSPIKLLLKISFPIIIGFFFSTMYNIVDTYFAGQLGGDALVGVGLSFPIFLFLLAIGVSLFNATNALISNSIGENQEQKAQKYLSHSLMLGLIISVSMSILVYLFLNKIYSFFNVSTEAQKGGVEYMQTMILYGGSLAMIMGYVINSSLNSRGFSFVYGRILIASFFLNIIFNYIFVYGLEIGEMQWIEPKGVIGIALSTATIQWISLIIFITYVFKHGYMPTRWNWDKKYVIEILSQSYPSFISMINVSVAMFIHNKFISIFGEDAVAAYGAAIRIEQIALIPFMGLGMALSTIVGQNYGAKQYVRMKMTLIYSFGMGLMVLLLLAFPITYYARFLLLNFIDSRVVVLIGTKYLHIQIFTFFAYIIISLSNSFLQAIKRPKAITYNEIFRQVIGSFLFFYPMVYLWNMGLEGIWWGIVFKNWISAIFIFIWLMIVYKKITKPQ